MGRRAFPFSKLAAAAAAAAILSAATHTLWLPAVGKALVVSEEPFPADAVVVLAGDRFGRRILKGAELVRRGYAPAAYVSGPCDYYGTCESDSAIDFAVKHGYPRASFVGVPHSALSTVEEAEVFARELRSRGCKRYILVTSDYHTRRACGLFRKEMPDLEMRCVAAGDRFFRADSWWKHRESRKAVFLEFMKAIAVRLGL